MLLNFCCNEGWLIVCFVITQSLSLYSTKMFAGVKEHVNNTAALAPVQGRLRCRLIEWTLKRVAWLLGGRKRWWFEEGGGDGQPFQKPVPKGGRYR